jgi:hypothetical protein
MRRRSSNSCTGWSGWNGCNTQQRNGCNGCNTPLAAKATCNRWNRATRDTLSMAAAHPWPRCTTNHACVPCSSDTPRQALHLAPCIVGFAMPAHDATRCNAACCALPHATLQLRRNCCCVVLHCCAGCLRHVQDTRAVVLHRQRHLRISTHSPVPCSTLHCDPVPSSTLHCDPVPSSTLHCDPVPSSTLQCPRCRP